MPKPKIFTYEKKVAFRDAFLFIIVCEGANREPDYFRFFDGMSSRVKVIPVVSAIGSAPRLLIDVAAAKVQELEASDETDRLWFVIDTDRWREQLHEIRQECEQHPNWKVAQSNPCFEVWLYFHAKAQLPVLPKINQCNNWKPHLPTVIQGGFNPDFHPIAIETAIINAKATYQATGYFPDPGSTQLWELGEELLALIQKELDQLKHRFPAPVVID
jgi:hypothetical protein